MLAVVSPKRTSRLLLIGAALVGPVLYSLLALYRLHYPGVHYDELLFTNAALGPIGDLFIFRRWHGVTLLLMPYIGALKAWFAMPIFTWFGVSVVSIRLPNVLLTALVLFGLWWLVRRPLGARLATAATVLLALDPNFIALTRTDFGPVVFALLCRVLVLAVVVWFLRTKKITTLLWLLPIMAAGLFNKLDFLWCINATFAALFLLNLRQVHTWLRTTAGRSTLVTLLLGYGVFVWYYLTLLKLGKLSVGLTGSAIKAHVLQWIVGWCDVLSGEGFFGHALAPYRTVFYGSIGLTLTLILLAGFYLINTRSQHRAWRSLCNFLVLSLVLANAQILVTSQASGPWHYLTVQPMLALMLVMSLAALYVWARQHFAKVGAGLVVVLCLALIAHFVLVYGLSVRSYRHPTNVSWSPAIYDLLAYTQSHSGRFLAEDWGMTTQLLAFDRQPNKYFDVTAAFSNSTPSTYANFAHAYFSAKPETTFLFHTQELSVFPEARTKAFAIAAEFGLTLHKVHEVSDGNRVIFELYQALPKP
ncbi:MAG: glycosyltransferase family 39 protein [Candidatus Andersenbacteria bacterium]